MKELYGIIQILVLWKSQCELIQLDVTFQSYPIPYYVITPKKEEVRNLLVSICISASHVAFNSVRLETQYMIMGQAAGVAASLAIDNNVPVQNVDIQQLTKILLNQGAILNL